MTWITFTALAIIFFTSTNLLQRVLSIDSKNPRALSFVYTAYAAVFATLAAFSTGKLSNVVLSVDSVAWLYLGVACLFWGLFERLRFVTAKLLDASLLSTVSTVSIVVAFIISAVIYNEPITFSKLAGLLLILVAVTIVSYTKDAKGSLRGVLISIFASILLGIAWSLDKMGANYFNTDTYSIFVWTLPLVIIYFPHIETKEIFYEAKLGSWKLVLLSLTTYLGYMTQLNAQVRGEATTVIPLVQLFVITTVFAGIILLNERDNIMKKVLAGIIAVTGAFLLL